MEGIIKIGEVGLLANNKNQTLKSRPIDLPIKREAK